MGPALGNAPAPGLVAGTVGITKTTLVERSREQSGSSHIRFSHGCPLMRRSGNTRCMVVRNNHAKRAVRPIMEPTNTFSGLTAGTLYYTYQRR